MGPSVEAELREELARVAEGLGASITPAFTGMEVAL